MSYLLNKPTFTYYENEPKPEGEPAPETFTPEQVDAKLKEAQSAFQKERSSMAQQLEEFQASSSLNEKQKQELEEQVTALREASMSTEERAKAALERKEKDYGEKVNNLQAERDEWQNKYTYTRIRNDILSSANSADDKPYHVDDIYNALAPDTFLKDLTDDLGKKTGNTEVVVKFKDIGDDGKPFTNEMAPELAVGRMSKMPRWSHLFQSGKRSGSDENAGKPGEPVDISKLAADDPVAFLELVKKNPSLLD